MTEDTIGLAGDWHGQLRFQQHALHTLGQRDIKTTFHVGDYGIAFGKTWMDYLASAESVCRRYGMTMYVTPGNHENWDYINSRKYDEAGMYAMAPHVILLKRNTVMQLMYGDEKFRTLLSLGGAASIDYEMRTQGWDWWRDEMLTYEDVTRAREIGNLTEVDIMITHDVPDGGTDRVQRILDNPDFSMWSHKGLAYANEGRVLMNHAIAGVKPRVFAHGHMHAADMKQTEETLFVSLGCNGQQQNLALLNLETLKADFIDTVLDVIPK